MKKNRKIILCISLICVFILLAAFSYWFFFYPYRVLGVESDSRYYSNHVVSKLTGREESTAVFDTFVTFVVNGEHYHAIEPGRGVGKYNLCPDRYSDKKREVLQKSKKYSEEKFFVFVREDLGKKIGVVEESSWQLLKGLEVYYYTPYPDGKICILKMKDGYGYQFLEHDQQ